MAGYGNKEGPATLMHLDLLTCCRGALTVPIFQCYNGHMNCRNCCERRSHRCAACSRPTIYHNIGMERVLEKLQFPCPNADMGCEEYVSYGDTLDERSTHLQHCKFTCVCLFLDCDFIGSYKDLYEHIISEHPEKLGCFEPGKKMSIPIGRDERMVLMERSSGGGELVVLDRSFSEDGECISVRCVAPNVPGKGDFNYKLTVHSGSYKKLVLAEEIKVVDTVENERPEVD